MNIAIITGASSGIGEQFLRQLVCERAAFGSVPFEEIWVIARRADRLLSMKNELDPVRIRVFTIDLTDDSAIADLKDELKKRNPTIGLLVNCAGVGRTGRFETISDNDVHRMVVLNCSVLAELTSICLPYMIPLGDLCTYATGPRILNIASSAGFLPQPGFAVYAATKSFVIHFSRALHAELRVHNIASTTVCPGPVSTEFASVATGVPNAKTSGFKSLFVVKPKRLVRKSILASKKARGLYVYGFSQKILHVLTKILPARFLIFLVTHLSKDAKPPRTIKPVPVVSAAVTEPVSPAAEPHSLVTMPVSHAAEPLSLVTMPVSLAAEPASPVSNTLLIAERIPHTSDQAAKILSMY